MKKSNLKQILTAAIAFSAFFAGEKAFAFEQKIYIDASKTVENADEIEPPPR